MLKNKLFTAVSPVIKTKNDKEDLFSHVNECIKDHMGNPLKKSKLAKLTADIFGYDNPHILPSSPKEISLTEAIELSIYEIRHWVDHDMGGYSCEDGYTVIPLFDFNDRDNNTIYTLCFIMKFNIVNHENYFLSLTTVIFDDAKNVQICSPYGHNEINELAASISTINDYGHHEQIDDFDEYIEEDCILKEIMEVAHFESFESIRATRALSILTSNEMNERLSWDINELKSIYKEASAIIAYKTKEVIGNYKNVTVINSKIYNEKESIQHLICNKQKSSLKNLSEYEIKIEFSNEETEFYTCKFNNYREALNYAHYKIMSTFIDNEDIFIYEFYQYDSTPSGFDEYEKYNKIISSRKVRDSDWCEALITVTDLKDKQNPIQIELYNPNKWKLPLLTYL